MRLINLFLTNLKYKKKIQTNINFLLVHYRKFNIVFIKYNFIIQKIVSIILTYSNSFLTIQNFKGKKIFNCSIKAVEQYNNKMQNLNNQILKHYYKVLVLKLKLIKIPVAFHFYNLNSNFNWFLQKISKKIFVVVVKSFKKYAHNGCRKKKLK